jgi:hypothetical protein
MRHLKTQRIKVPARLNRQAYYLFLVHTHDKTTPTESNVFRFRHILVQITSIYAAGNRLPVRQKLPHPSRQYVRILTQNTNTRTAAKFLLNHDGILL